jgi:hypothetical protein
MCLPRLRPAAAADASRCVHANGSTWWICRGRCRCAAAMTATPRLRRTRSTTSTAARARSS